MERYSGSWMTIWDDRILEIIHDEGASSPKTLADTELLHISRQHISNRLNKMADNGLLHRLPNGVYTITEAGEAYLKGRYDAEAGKFLDEVGDADSGVNETEEANGV